MRRTALTLVLALAILVAAAPGAGAAKRRVPRGFYGTIFAGPIETAPDDVRAQAWDALAEAGVESVRAVFYWQFAQPRQDDPYDWEPTDRIVAAAAVHDIALMPTIDGVPDWARQYPGVAGSPPADGYGFAGYARFAADLVGRYGPKGSFWAEHPELPRRPVRTWQIWNEPNISDHWARSGGGWPKHEVARYGRLLRGAYQAIHEADLGAKVVLAGLTNFAWDDLAKLYRYGHPRGYFDVAAVHMFPGDWRNVAVIVRRFRHVLDSHGARKMPIWVTEMTWPAAKGRTTVPPFADTPYYRNFITTDHGSAKRLSNAYRLLASSRFRAENRVDRVTWFLATSSYEGNTIWDYSGLIRLSGTSLSLKPSYRAFRTQARRGEGCSKTASGSCR